jgi:hypothetical protein
MGETRYTNAMQRSKKIRTGTSWKAFLLINCGVDEDFEAWADLITGASNSNSNF